MGMTIDELNQMTAAAADPVLRGCVDIDSWVFALISGRPYADRAALLRAATDQAARWSQSEVDHALRDHPRIGEQPRAESATASLSRSEQAGMTGADAALTERMRSGNAAYEERFGRIYLVRAAGRTATELVELLEARLGNDADTEALETKRQLAEIAVLRLRGLVVEPPPEGQDAA